MRTLTPPPTPKRPLLNILDVVGKNRPAIGILSSIVRASLNKDDVAIKVGPDVEHATATVIQDVMNKATDAGLAVVQTKSDWASKTVWVNIIGFVAVVAGMFGLDIDAKTQAEIIAGVAAVVQIATVIIKKWFTNTVSASSLPADPPTG